MIMDAIKIYRVLTSVFILMFLSACNENLHTGCIDADDFGQPRFNINSAGYNLQAIGQEQVSEWFATGYVYNGDPINFAVKNGNDNRWTSWYGSISNILQTVPKCTFDPSMCPADPTIRDIPANNVPCYFDKGKGLYTAFMPKDAASPNSSQTFMLNPASAGAAVLHLGESESATYLYSPVSMGGGPAGGLVISSSLGNQYIDGQVYFKILDRFYSDNMGQYTVIAKSGLKDPSHAIINAIVFGIQDIVKQQVQDLYEGILQESAMPQLVRMLLTLYVIIIFVTFIMGLSQFKIGDLVIHLTKISVILVLFGGSSGWEIINEYFLNFFWYGPSVFVATYSAGADATSSTLFDYYDQMLAMFFSEPVNARINALMAAGTGTSKFVGFTFACVFYVVVFLFMIAIAKAIGIYILTTVAIAILAIIAPIFFLFWLFGQTKDFFNRWVDMLIGFFFQILFVFVGLTVFANIIMFFLYYNLGFSICWVNLWDNPVFKFYGWKIPDLSHALVTMPNPAGYYDANNDWHGPYSMIVERYPEMPFLIPASGGVINDQLKIDRMFSGEYIEMWDVFIFCLVIYIMYKFSSMLNEIGKGIATSSVMFTNVGFKEASDLFSSIGNAFKDVGSTLVHSKYAPEPLRKGVERLEKAGSFVKGFHQESKGEFLRTLKGGRDSALKKLPGVGNIIKRYESSKTALETMQDTRGSKFDAVLGLKMPDQNDPNLSDATRGYMQQGGSGQRPGILGAALDHGKYLASGGLYGQSINDANGGRQTNGEKVAEDLSKVFGFSKGKEKNIGETLQNFGRRFDYSLNPFDLFKDNANTANNRPWLKK